MRLPSPIRFAAAVVVFVLGAAATPAAGPARFKDVATLQGISSSPLIGYGLVVGLNKTGDKRQTVFSVQTLTNMLNRLGVKVSPDEIKVENIAAVLVTAELPPFARTGARLDVTVSSAGDARSLQGGTLLATALHAPNGDVIGLAQGPLSVGGFGGGSGGTSVQVNHLTVGRVPGGAVLETVAATPLPTSTLMFVLHDPDFVTASHVTQAINSLLGAGAAKAIDAGTVSLVIPDAFKAMVPELMAKLDDLPVDTETVARVVINERTGTVVVGGDVRIGAAAVAHGNLSVRISTHYDVSQPNPFAPSGQTTVVPTTRVDVQEGNAKLVTLDEGTTLESVARALNALGATPRDIIAIMQALKAAGALRAEIVIL
jgi:flagellar P-ring protein precursor FlgI